MKTKRMLLLTILLLGVLLERDVQAFYNPSAGRWLNRDPINEIGFKVLTQRHERFNRKEENNLYRFNANNSVNYFDAEGLWVVCRRAVRVLPGEPWYYGLFAHVDIAEDCSKCGNSTEDEDVSCYPIRPDPKCKCPPDTAKCLEENPYNRGDQTWGSNCQSNTLDRLRKCCLIAPGWNPDIYAYPPPWAPNPYPPL